MLETLSRRLREEWDVPSPEEDRPQDIRYLCVSGSVEGGTAALLGFFKGQRRPSFVAKVQRDPEERDSGEGERTVLDALRSRGEPLRSSVPKVLFCGRVDGFWVLVESVIDGSPMTATLSADGVPEPDSARRNIDLAVDWLIACHGSGAADLGSRSLDWTALALPPIVEFGTVFQLSPAERAHLEGLRGAIEGLRGRRVPLLIRHGDFCRHNILLSWRHGTPRIGVIDWTFSRPVGLPLHDLVFFLGTYCLQIRKEHGVAGLERMFEYTFLERNPYSRLVSDGLGRYCRALEIDRPLVRVLFALFLIEQSLFEYRQVAKALRRGRVPRFAMFLAACEGRAYEEVPKAQLWPRFFRLFVHEPSRLVA